MPISRHEEWVQIAELDAQDQIRFTPEFQSLVGDLGWEAKAFVGHLLELWYDPFEHLLDYTSGEGLQLKDVAIDDKLVRDNERMLTGGFYAEVDLSYDAVIAQEKNGTPFTASALRPIQLSKRDVLDALYAGRKKFSTGDWKNFLFRSVGLEPTAMTDRNRDAMLLRMIPFVDNNLNSINC